MSAISPCDEAAAKQRQPCFDVFTISAEYYNGTEINTNVLFIHTPTHLCLFNCGLVRGECGRGVIVGGKKGGGAFLLYSSAKGTGSY